MRLFRLGVISKDQRGFTLLETILAILIAGIICSAATGTTFQIIAWQSKTNTSLVATAQIESAMFWVSRDTQVSQRVTLDPGPSGLPLVLSRVEWDGTTHEVTYHIDQDKLYRDYTIDGTLQDSFVVAQHIIYDEDSTYPDKTSVRFEDDLLSFSLMVTVDGFRPTTQTRVVTVFSRPKS